jgi:Animal haem peroxidase
MELPMERHGFETYFVLGEGLLGESGEGRTRGLAATEAAANPPFRFSRMGPHGQDVQLGEANRKKIAAAMIGNSSPSQVPAGFTYLGQFIDHDLTFDVTQVMFGAHVTPAQLLQGRSPSLDLDSLYGAGPGDSESQKFYSDGVHLKLGDTDATGDPALPGFDLPRVGTGPNAAARRKALIPDPRNDENLAVAQTHLAMIKFHNRVVDSLPAALPDTQKFAQARELVTKHYQWMIRTDYLPRIVKRRPIDDVFRNGRKAFEVNAAPTDVPTMPIEFSVAAFRLGHSMIRESYNWNKNFPGTAGSLDLLFTFSGLSGDFIGGPRLPSNWIADFRRLYDFKNEAGRADLAAPGGVNRAMRIDTKLADTLGLLHPQTVSLPNNTPDSDFRRNLAFRNLVRANMVRLTSGQKMLRFLRNRVGPMTGLTKTQLRDGSGGATLGTLTATQQDALLRNTPLWFWLLREAELNNGKLRGVGGRIVAETFHRAMEGSRFSIVREPTWRPTLGPNNTTFRMVDLLLFAHQGRADQLNPLGDV